MQAGSEPGWKALGSKCRWSRCMRPAHRVLSKMSLKRVSRGKVSGTCAAVADILIMCSCVGSELVVVFFAPSSAELALPVIRKHFTLRSSSGAQVDGGKPVIRVAAIGPTTARALTENHTIQVDAVSNKPDPEALTEAILSLWST